MNNQYSTAQEEEELDEEEIESRASFDHRGEFQSCQPPTNISKYIDFSYMEMEKVS